MIFSLVNCCLLLIPQLEGASRYYEVDDMCNDFSSKGSLRSPLKRSDPEYKYVEGYMEFFTNDKSR